MAKKSKFIWVGMTAGVLLMFTSYLISKFSTITFLLEVHSEIFGAGVVLFIIALIFKLFKIKLT